MLTALSILGVLVALFLAAALATRDSQALAPAPPDAADLDLASPATAESVRRLRFGLALRGYRMSEVDGVLEQLAEELEQRDARLAELEGVSPAGAGAPATDAAFGEVAPPADPASADSASADRASAPARPAPVGPGAPLPPSAGSTAEGTASPLSRAEDLPSGPPVPPREADHLPGQPVDPPQVRTS